MRFCSLAKLTFTVTALSVMVLPLAGCGVTETQAWKESRRFYYSHVNTPAQLDLADPGSLPSAERRLVTRLMPLDEQLAALERTLDSLPAQIDGQTTADVLRRFPWLSGLVLVDAEGQVLDAIPSMPLKDLDYTVLLQPAPKTSARAIRASVQETAMGPEVLMARPLFEGAEMKALLVATFDFRSLLPYVENAGSLLVRSPDVLLWSGDDLYEETPLAGTNWDKAVRSHSYGTLSGKKGSAVWLVRYVGVTPLIFAVVK